MFVVLGGSSVRVEWEYWRVISISSRCPCSDFGSRVNDFDGGWVRRVDEGKVMSCSCVGGDCVKLGSAEVRCWSAVEHVVYYCSYRGEDWEREEEVHWTIS